MRSLLATRNRRPLDSASRWNCENGARTLGRVFGRTMAKCRPFDNSGRRYRHRLVNQSIDPNPNRNWWTILPANTAANPFPNSNHQVPQKLVGEELTSLPTAHLPVRRPQTLHCDKSSGSQYAFDSGHPIYCCLWSHVCIHCLAWYGDNATRIRRRCATTHRDDVWLRPSLKESHEWIPIDK